MVLKPKTLAAPAEVPPMRVAPGVGEHADRVAQIRPTGIGAEEVAR